jgi:ABC-type nitrate/sulfonate/bicarbonate transport system permease component
MTTESSVRGTPMPPAPATATAALGDSVERLRRRQTRERRKRLAWAILTPVTLLALWEIASRVGILDQRFFPSPVNIVADSFGFVTDSRLRGQLLHNLAESGTRLALGFVLGTVAGLVVGLAMGLHPVTRYALGGVINGTYSLPKLTLFPLMIVFFGIGNTSMIALVALGVFFMVSINTTSGVIYSSPVYDDVARSFELPRLVRLRLITIPAAIPSVISGIRLGFGQALIIVVSTEFVSGNGGIGYLIWNSWQILDVPMMFVGLTIVGLTGWLVSAGINRLGKALAPWESD